MPGAIKRAIKRNLPQSLLRLVRSYKNRDYNRLSPEQIFTRIYETRAWGDSGDPDRPFFSGSGSHRDEETSTYVQAVVEFLTSLRSKPDVADLGCGDFFVGSKLRQYCGRYTACDVVPSLIEFNRKKFRDLGVEFKSLDLTRDELPPGDVAFVRQVLQHLSNGQIKSFVQRAPLAYKYLVVTEHLPVSSAFEPNADKPAGPGTRMGYESGVVLTAAPFNLRPKAEQRLCQVDSVDTGILVTTLYTL